MLWCSALQLVRAVYIWGKWWLYTLSEHIVHFSTVTTIWITSHIPTHILYSYSRMEHCFGMSACFTGTVKGSPSDILPTVHRTPYVASLCLGSDCAWLWWKQGVHNLNGCSSPSWKHLGIVWDSLIKWELMCHVDITNFSLQEKLAV